MPRTAKKGRAQAAQEAPQPLTYEEERAAILARISEATASFGTMLETAVDTDGFYATVQVDNMLQARRIQEERPPRMTPRGVAAQVHECDEEFEEEKVTAGREYLADRLTGREAAAVIIQRAWRLYKHRRQLGKWHSIAFLKTHIPDRVYAASRNHGVSPLRSYSIRTVGGEIVSIHETSRPQIREREASLSPSLSGRMRIAFGSLIKPPEKSSVGRVLPRSSTLPTHGGSPPASGILSSMDVGTRLSAQQRPGGLDSPNRAAPLLRSSFIDRLERSSSPGGSQLGGLPSIADVRSPAGLRPWGASQTVVVRASPFMDAPPAPDSPVASASEPRSLDPVRESSPSMFIRSERSVSMPGFDVMLPPASPASPASPGRGGPLCIGNVAQPRSVGPTPPPQRHRMSLPGSGRTASPAGRSCIVMLRESALGPALLASKLVSQATGTGPGGPAAAAAAASGSPSSGRQRRLSTPLTLDTIMAGGWPAGPGSGPVSGPLQGQAQGQGQGYQGVPTLPSAPTSPGPTGPIRPRLRVSLAGCS